MKYSAVTIAAVAPFAAPMGAQAANIIQNGDFTDLVNRQGVLYAHAFTFATGWSVDGGSASFDMVYSQDVAPAIIRSPTYRVANGCTAPPASGNILMMDGGACCQAGLSQTVNNLTIGSTYVLDFWSAYGQYYLHYGDTEQYMTVAFGSDVVQLPTVDLPSQGFSGWLEESLAFTAYATSEVLTFFNTGTPDVPPIALIPGVTMQVPEPAWMALPGSDLALLGGTALRRRRAARPAPG